MATPSFYVIGLTNDGHGRTSVNLGGTIVTLVTRWNTTVSAWSLDILDQSENLILAGLMMVPGVNLLKGYPVATAMIGGLSIAEKHSGDYRNPSLLGSDVILLWFPPGAEVLLPMPPDFISTLGISGFFVQDATGAYLVDASGATIVGN